MVELAGTDNVRDLGPLPTVDGRSVRAGRVYRGEALTGFNSTDPPAGPDAAPFRRLGLRSVVDLRSDAEHAAGPSAWSGITGADVLRIPVAEGGEGSATYLMGWIQEGRILRYSADDLGALYIATLERQSAAYAAVMRTLAREENLPSLIHCVNGKDRTGIVVALLLSFLGVPRDHIVADYVLTGVNRPGQMERYAPLVRAAGVDPEAVRAMFETPEVAIQMLLDHLESGGGTERYLVEQAGLTRRELDRLRELLTTDPDALTP